MRFNYRRTDDHLLALAAYNAGDGRIRRLLEETGARDYWELRDSGRLPRETAGYVPQFLAVMRIASYPGRYGLTLDWRETLRWERLDPGTSVDINLLAAATGTDPDLLRTGNPELLYDVTPPAEDGWLLKVPAGTADDFREVLSRDDTGLTRFWRHTVRTGDTLSGIAVAWSVPLEMVVRYNRKVDSRFLRTGQIILVPAVPGASPPPEREEPVRAVFDDRYLVRAGDSLWSIARRFGVTPELLAERNYLPLDGVLREGTVLDVPAVSGRKEDGDEQEI